MNSLTVAICDDEILILPQLSSKISKIFKDFGFDTNISAFSNSPDLLASVYNHTNFDVYFLDIDIAEINGIALALRLRKLLPNALLVFVSAKEEFVFETFQVQPFSFVRKSNFDKDMVNTISKLIQKFEVSPEPYIFISDSLGHSHKFNINQLIYVEGNDKYLNIVSSNGNQLIRYLLAKIEQDLDQFQFIRIHKSYLVNSKFIYKIRQKDIVLDSGLTLPVSRYRLEEVKRLFCNYTNP